MLDIMGWVGSLCVVLMYLLIGYYPDSKITPRFALNVASGVIFCTIGIATGMWFLIFMQFVAIYMGYKQWKHYKQQGIN